MLSNQLTATRAKKTAACDVFLRCSGQNTQQKHPSARRIDIGLRNVGTNPLAKCLDAVKPRIFDWTTSRWAVVRRSFALRSPLVSRSRRRKLRATGSKIPNWWATSNIYRPLLKLPSAQHKPSWKCREREAIASVIQSVFQGTRLTDNYLHAETRGASRENNTPRLVVHTKCWKWN